MQAEAVKREQHATHSSGRGGMGNMTGPRDESPRGRENAVSSALRSLSRSRSREPRSSSGQRVAASTDGDKLASVDEASTINGGSTQHDKGHHGLAHKIASHIPGMGHSNQAAHNG